MLGFNSYFAIKLLFVIVSGAHILYCPFSKVEESFNIQAIHDIQSYGFNLKEYDHNEFPGVVPRTFIGPLVISALSYPSKILAEMTSNSFIGQVIARFTLACLVSLGLFSFVDSIKKLFGQNVAKITLLITLTQFHFVFYMSRTLPNTFALMVFLHAISFWLQQKYKGFIWLTAASVLLFRSEIAIMAGIMLMITIFRNFKTFNFVEFFLHSILAGVTFISLSVVVDSYFWGRWLWPEGEVLWFNVVLNKSSEWGTSPFLWYFYSAIPRALLFSIVFIPFGFLFDQKKTFFSLLLPVVGFVFIYSFLPHKELRFIIYVFPLLNVIAAKGIVDFQKYRINFKIVKQLMTICIYMHFILNIIATGGFLYISRLNYPGAEALMRLHEIEHNKIILNVHIDVYSAQTGITRFTELNRNSGWKYDKSENLNKNDLVKFDYLLIEAESSEDKRLEPYKNTHKVADFIRTYNGIYFNLNKIPLPKIRWIPKIFLLKRL